MSNFIRLPCSRSYKVFPFLVLSLLEYFEYLLFYPYYFSILRKYNLSLNLIIILIKSFKSLIRPLYFINSFYTLSSKPRLYIDINKPLFHLVLVV